MRIKIIIIIHTSIVYKQDMEIGGSSEQSSVRIIIVSLLFLTCSDGNSFCDFEPCLDTYNTLKSLYDNYRNEDVSKIPIAVSNTICAEENELKDCTKKQSKSCRGDLNYHFFVRLAQRIQTQNARMGKNCSENSTGTVSGQSSSLPSSNSAQNHQTGNSGSGSRYSGRGFGSKCTPKYSPSDPSIGCALYGLTNLKSFSDPLNFSDVPYCSLSGAWSLLDSDSVAVQITNKGGLSPLPKDITTTTLVTVIVKNNECAERRTYQATFDEVPAMFSDGSSSAGTVYIEELKRSEHVRIHFPYISTFIEIIRVIGHLPISTLSVTIKMPQQNVSNTSRVLNRATKGVPLCFYGCPKTANIKPRSIDPAHRCPTESEEESSSTEFMDTANSITSAICDSLANVQTILKETSVLEQRLRFSGEENFVTTQSDSSGTPLYPQRQRHHNHSKNSQTTDNSSITHRLNFGYVRYFLLAILFSYR